MLLTTPAATGIAGSAGPAPRAVGSQARQDELLPGEYYHVVFTLPAPVAALALHKKALVFRLLFEVAARTLCTIAADPKHMGARINATLVLHTWGSALTHHPQSLRL